MCEQKTHKVIMSEWTKQPKKLVSLVWMQKSVNSRRVASWCRVKEKENHFGQVNWQKKMNMTHFSQTQREHIDLLWEWHISEEWRNNPLLC